MKARSLPIDQKHNSPVHIIYNLASLAALSILVGAALPGIVAYETGVFNGDSITTRVKSRYPDVADKLARFDTSRDQARNALKRLDSQIASGVAIPTNVTALRQAYVQELSKPAPVSMQPFASHLVVYFWPIMYFGLATAIFIIKPSADYTFTPGMIGPVVRLTVLIFAFSVTPLLFRTLLFAGPNSGRTVYAWTNPDLSPACFACQVSNFAVFSLCLAINWVQWSQFAETRRLPAAKKDGFSHGVSLELMTDLSRMLYRWQVTFLSIAVGFIIYTAIFWNQIVRNHDYRFVVEGIMAHVFWIVTITITSIPLLTTWRAWHEQKLSAITVLVNQAPASDILDQRINVIKDLEPIPGWNLTASVAAILTSLIGPAIQALIK